MAQKDPMDKLWFTCENFKLQPLHFSRFFSYHIFLSQFWCKISIVLEKRVAYVRKLIFLFSIMERPHSCLVLLCFWDEFYQSLGAQDSMALGIFSSHRLHPR